MTDTTHWSNIGLELPSPRELALLDALETARRAAEGTSMEGHLSLLLREAYDEALFCSILGGEAMQVLDRHGPVPARQVCILVLGD